MVTALSNIERAAAVSAALLALVFLYEALVPMGVPDTPAIALPPIAVSHLFVADTAQPPSVVYAAITEKPLFLPTRTRPSLVVAKPETAAPPPPPNVYLVGVIADSAGSLALVRSPDSPLETSLRAGQTIGGWQITQILPDRMILTSGAVQDEVRLDAPHPMDAPPSKPNPQTPQQTPPQQTAPSAH
jgi:hypothetical protein